MLNFSWLVHSYLHVLTPFTDLRAKKSGTFLDSWSVKLSCIFGRLWSLEFERCSGNSTWLGACRSVADWMATTTIETALYSWPP